MIFPLPRVPTRPVGAAGGVRSVGGADTDDDAGDRLPWVSTATSRYV